MSLLLTSTVLITGVFAGQSCTQNDMCGAGEKCYDSECIISDGNGNMCGSGGTAACFECFECNKDEDSCMPISGCVASVCEEDEDCERGQICYNSDCALPDKIPGSCIGRDSACDGLAFFDCKRDTTCRWDDDYDNDAGMGSKRKGGKGNRGNGGRLLSKHAGMASLLPFNIASLESEQKGLSYDADGAIEYDEDGYAVLTEYAEMCGGKNADEECYECFECSRGGNRCIPISDCVPSCSVDDDCTREQICVEGENVCRLEGGRPGGYRDSEDNGAGMGSERKGGKGNRGDGDDDSDDDDSSWGGPVISVDATNIAALEAEQKGLSYDADGEIEYDEDGYAVLTEYAEMCGGKDADEECYECFECSRGGNRCIPISDCVPSCEVDDDCTREQICVEGENVCRLEGGRPGGYRDSEDNGAGMGSERKGGKGNRGDGDDDSDDDDSSWGGPVISAEATNIAALEDEQKGLSYDANGEIEYDEDGYAVLTEYAEMCGGRDADQECYECFECSSGGSRCIPVEGCVPACEIDDDCTRAQICVEGENVCRLPGGRPCGGYDDSEDCDDAGMGSSRKGGKGNRGDGNDDSDDDDDSSWGGPAISADATNIAALEAEEKGLSYDADGAIEYDEDGYAVLTEYAEMCGGKDADEECYECFECSRGGNRCIPISDCVPSCSVDDDCTREQICVEGENVCRLEGGRPGGYRDSEDNGAGMGSERKGGKGNRGDGEDDDDEEAVVMKNGFTMEASEESSQSVSYLALIWCSIAAVLAFAAASLIKYWRRSAVTEKNEVATRSSHMKIDGQVYF